MARAVNAVPEAFDFRVTRPPSQLKGFDLRVTGGVIGGRKVFVSASATLIAERQIGDLAILPRTRFRMPQHPADDDIGIVVRVLGLVELGPLRNFVMLAS